MNKAKKIKEVIADTSGKISDLLKGKSRADPIDADIELSLKAMAYEKIVEIVEHKET